MKNEKTLSFVSRLQENIGFLVLKHSEVKLIQFMWNIYFLIRVTFFPLDEPLVISGRLHTHPSHPCQRTRVHFIKILSKNRNRSSIYKQLSYIYDLS